MKDLQSPIWSVEQELEFLVLIWILQHTLLEEESEKTHWICILIWAWKVMVGLLFSLWILRTIWRKKCCSICFTDSPFPLTSTDSQLPGPHKCTTSEIRSDGSQLIFEYCMRPSGARTEEDRTHTPGNRTKDNANGKCNYAFTSLLSCRRTTVSGNMVPTPVHRQRQCWQLILDACPRNVHKSIPVISSWGDNFWGIEREFLF